jgi:hypothetical protein
MYSPAETIDSSVLQPTRPRAAGGSDTEAREFPRLRKQLKNQRFATTSHILLRTRKKLYTRRMVVAKASCFALVGRFLRREVDVEIPHNRITEHLATCPVNKRLRTGSCSSGVPIFKIEISQSLTHY